VLYHLELDLDLDIGIDLDLDIGIDLDLDLDLELDLGKTRMTCGIGMCRCVLVPNKDLTALPALNLIIVLIDIMARLEFLLHESHAAVLCRFVFGIKHSDVPGLAVGIGRPHQRVVVNTVIDEIDTLTIVLIFAEIILSLSRSI